MKCPKCGHEFRKTLTCGHVEAIDQQVIRCGHCDSLKTAIPLRDDVRFCSIACRDKHTKKYHKVKNVLRRGRTRNPSGNAATRTGDPKGPAA